MGLILALIIGGIIGWLASIVMRTNGQQGKEPYLKSFCRFETR